MSHQERGLHPSKRDRLVKTAQRGLQFGVGVVAVFSANVVDVDNTQASSRVEPTANRLELPTLPLTNSDYLRIQIESRAPQNARGRGEMPPLRSGRGERQPAQNDLLFNGGFQEQDPQNPSKPRGWNLDSGVEYVFRGPSPRGDSSVISRVDDCPSGVGGTVSQEDGHLIPLGENPASYNLEYVAIRRNGGLNNQPRAVLKFYNAAGNLLHTLRANGVPQKPLGERETFKVSFVPPAGAQSARLSLQAMDIACSLAGAEVEFLGASVQIARPR